MKTIVTLLGLLFSISAFGQLNVSKLSNEEVNYLGYCLNDIYKAGRFNDDDIKKLKLENILGFLIEFQCNDKIIAQKIVPVYPYIGTEGFYFNIPQSTSICIEMNDITTDIAFNLLKNNWKNITTTKKEEFLCTEWDIPFFKTEDRKTYEMNSLLEGKIQMSLYRLEK